MIYYRVCSIISDDLAQSHFTYYLSLEDLYFWFCINMNPFDRRLTDWDLFF